MSGTYDFMSPEFFDEPHATFARMRQDDPVYFDPVTHQWCFTRYDDVALFLRDKRWSSQRVDLLFMRANPEREQQIKVCRQFYSNWLIFSDAPHHTRLRKLLVRAFSARAVVALEAYVQQAVDVALDKMSEAREIDLVADFAFPIPAQVIAHILGVAPDHMEPFKVWSADALRIASMVGDPDENVAATYRGIRNLETYFEEVIAGRRKARVDDLLGTLIDADEDGRILSKEELVANAALLLMAGHQTTTHLIGNAVFELLRHPAQLARLQENPGLIDSAIDEVLRYNGPGVGIGRIALEDIELHGRVLPAGQFGFCFFSAANRDPAVFDDPDRFDIGRGDKRHLSFGQGMHLCIGSTLARMEARIAVGSLLARFPRLQLATDKPDWSKSLAFRGLTSLPLSVHAARHPRSSDQLPSERRQGTSHGIAT
jgi:cytochrome P450